MDLTKLSAAALADGEVIREPVGEGSGYWVGAPGVFHEPEEDAFYLTYRIRRPRGVEPDRGGVARIARSADGRRFEDIWEVTKKAFSSTSIERCALRRSADGLWRYYPAFVDPADGRWCVAKMKARSIAELDAVEAEPLFRAADLGLEGVKDPWIYERQGVFYMILSVATATADTSGGSHATQDIYNTGECKSATALAVSRDLDEWDWKGVVFAPESPGWDGYCRRINSLVRDGERFLAVYDGSASHEENYEEKTGFAESADLVAWRTLSPDGPSITSPNASGSLRYMDCEIARERLWAYYEFARPDGSHDVRVASFGLE